MLGREAEEDDAAATVLDIDHRGLTLDLLGPKEPSALEHVVGRVADGDGEGNSASAL